MRRQPLVAGGPGKGARAAPVADTLARVSWPVWLASLALLFVVAHGGALSAGGIWDEREFISANPAVHTLERPWRFFTDPWTATPFGSAFLAQYRPLRLLLYAFEYRLFAGDAWGYHLVSLLLHAVGAWGVAALTRRLFGRGAWLAAGLWLVHPLHAEIALNIAAQGNLICAAAVVWALERHLAWLGGESRMPWLWATSLTAVACLAYESGALLPLLVLLIEAAWRAQGRPLPGKWPVRLAPYLAAVGAYIAARTAAVIPATPIAWWGGSWWGSVALELRFWLNAWRLTFVPTGIVPRYLGDELPSWVTVGAAVAFHLVLVTGLVYWWRRRGKLLPLAVAWWYLAQLPTANVLVALPGYPFASRMVFLAMVLPVAAAAAAMAPFVVRRPAYAALAAAWLLLALAEDRRQGRVWHAPTPFFSAITAARPGDSVALEGLAMAALEAGQLERAAALGAEAARSDPAGPTPPYIAGEVARRRGDLGSARAAYIEALARQRLHLPALLAYAELELADGRAERMLNGLAPVLAVEGVSSENRARIGVLQAVALQRLGRCRDAVGKASQAAELWPYDAGLLLRAGRVLAQCGERERARRLYPRAAAAAAEDVRAQLAPGP